MGKYKDTRGSQKHLHGNEKNHIFISVKCYNKKKNIHKHV